MFIYAAINQPERKVAFDCCIVSRKLNLAMKTPDPPEYFLRSCSPEGRCPDIALEAGAEARLGRGPATRVTDSRVSRHHVTVTRRHDTCHGVTVTQAGPNHSVVAGRALVQGEEALLLPGQTLELLEGLHKFKLIKNSASADSAKEASQIKNEIASNKSHWSQGLLSSMNDPEFIVHSTDTITIIKDKYPKAKHHYLLLPRKRIPDLRHVTRDDLELLEHMDEEARLLAARHPEAEFRHGYHAVASMAQLHLHLISQDSRDVNEISRKLFRGLLIRKDTLRI